MNRSIIEKLIDAPADEAEEYFESRGRRIGSWILLGVAGSLSILSLIFPNLFIDIIPVTAWLMASILFAAETIGRFIHNRKLSYLLYSFIFVIGTLVCTWAMVDSSIYIMSKI